MSVHYRMGLFVYLEL